MARLVDPTRIDKGILEFDDRTDDRLHFALDIAEDLLEKELEASNHPLDCRTIKEISAVEHEQSQVVQVFPHMPLHIEASRRNLAGLLRDGQAGQLQVFHWCILNCDHHIEEGRVAQRGEERVPPRVSQTEVPDVHKPRASFCARRAKLGGMWGCPRSSIASPGC